MKETARCRTAAIVLGAGASSRMGTDRQKLLLPIHGRPMIEHVVRAACDSRADVVFVVTGVHHDAIAALVGEFSNVTCVRNPDPYRGMLSSVRAGLEAMDDSTNAIAVLLGDQPGIDASMIDAVLTAWEVSPASIAIPTFDGRRGHPLVFDRCHRNEVLTRFDDVGLRGLLAAHPDAVLEVPLQAREVLEDIDTPEEYARQVHDEAKERNDG